MLRALARPIPTCKRPPAAHRGQNRKAQLTGATDLTLPEFELCAQRPKQRSRFGGYDDRAPSHRSREEHAGPADHEIAEQIEAIDAAV